MKTPRKLAWVAVPLTVVAILAIVIGAVVRTEHASDQGVMSAQEAREFKAALISGRGDPDSAVSADPDRASPGSVDTDREGPISSANQQFFEQRAYPAADIPPDGYAIALNQYSLMNQPGTSYGWRELGPLSTPNGSIWGPAAPSTVSGRATAIAVDPSTCSGGSCKTIYLGTANGGIFKSTTGGHNWVEVFDHQSTEAIGSLALDPRNSNVIYAGTGEPNNAIDNNRGGGILKSTNGGHTWTVLGYDHFVNRAVADIVVDPANGNIYAISYLARSGGAGTTYGNSLNNPYLPPVGFYRSTDGGKSWTLSNPTSTLFTDSTGRSGPTSLVRASDGTLYIGVYGQGIYESSDGGQHWSPVANPGETRGRFDRVTLAVAPSDPSVLYAAFSHTIDGSGPMTFYQSTDGGSSWTKRPDTPDACDGQCWYDMPVAVSPTDPNEVYVGGMFNYAGAGPAYPFPAHGNTVIMKSTNGGATWRDIGYNEKGDNVHPDDHAILPTADGGLYTANDGGLYHSADDGATWESLNNGIGSLQFQSVSVNSNGYVFGGTQDNGTWMMAPNKTKGVHILGGDGGMTAADPNNPNIVFDENYGSTLQRFDMRTGRHTWMAGWWCDYFCFGQGLFYEPVALGTKNPDGTSASNDVFSATNRLWRSSQGGGVDGNNDGDATNDPSDTTDFVPITPMYSANISVIAVSPTDPNRVAIGLTDGRIYYTENALAPVKTVNLCATSTDGTIQLYCRAAHVDPTWSGEKVCSQPWLNTYDTSSFCGYESGVDWKRIDNDGSTQLLPTRWVTSLTFDQEGKLYATFSGFDENTPGAPGHVFVTGDGGTTWTDITSNLPDMPTNGIVVNRRGHLFVAADYGVFMSKDGGKSWRREDYVLANAPVYQLALSPDGNWLYGATHGRGIWKAYAP